MPTDPRFARLQTDPRFRRPKQKNLKVVIDERFREVLESDEFGQGGKGVDKRGKKLGKDHQRQNLKRFYRLASPETQPKVDYARGEAALPSSGSEDEGDEDEDEEESQSESEEEEIEIGAKRKRRYGLGLDEALGLYNESESEESYLDVDLSEDDILPVSKKERKGESSSGRREGDEDDKEVVEMIEPTERIAAVNLDWDNLRATDLFAIFNSFLKSGDAGRTLGRLVNVKIYPSEFGKERMAKEDEQGPAGGIFLNKERRRARGSVSEGSENDEDEEIDGQEDGESEDEDEMDLGSDEDEEAEEENDLSDKSNLGLEQDMNEDMDQLRQYQLERLRYYYAIATFSTVEAAKHVMEECNGTEFERTANVLDLSYVPNGMEFDDEPKDEATKEPKAYKGNDFVTDALRHSKVKLTWDQDDPNRNKITRRALTREEIEEQDFKDYLASSSGESDSDDDQAIIAAPLPTSSTKRTHSSIPLSKVEASSSKAEGSKSKKRKIKERTAKLRSLLLAPNEDDGDLWGKAGRSNTVSIPIPEKEGQVEITFRPGLSKTTTDEEDMTTLEKYQMRIKEKKAKKQEAAELRRAENGDPKAGEDVQVDEFFGDDSDEERHSKSIKLKNGKSVLGREKGKRNGELEGKKQRDDSVVEMDMEVPMGREDAHFSMKDVMKAEKMEGKKRKRNRNKKKGREDEREVELGPEGWKMDVKDERFKVLHEEPEFAIDPSDPHFTSTKAMKAMLEERRRIRQSVENSTSVYQSGKKGESEEKGLRELVKSVKMRSKLKR
ncbi:hypothetical protein TREMEDRAFT_68226 [Tremella mesenterica DSM 1558]|uniref:uncharacterized protein n=1 Tax=Tremella mesenterica (strain ATCC 24925 / CBS 8224 / DSM 1558 / NBRC 9311 / NRRL Y-6157 / RJB 2259-6 / UBC 559-6) TaxID=578456 RepID=UPI0003F4A345|nr:uncharacterized protein TREMEDRAFT_68226 [Tremella mesenterica DSM 1558]EIW70790.1 hypothetical protein TREMEDRAFT_68226 [Tremella mesenterica DSM 1558]